MKSNLTHEIEDCQLFCTITLPKTCYRKGPVKQAEIMLRHLKQIFLNYFDFMDGALELTNKGNVHAHFLGKYKEGFFEKLEFKDEFAKHRAYMLAIMSALKKFSIVDVQIAKDKNKIIEYYNKDIDVTAKIIERNPKFTFRKSFVLMPSETLDQIAQQPKEVCTSCLDWEINIINDSFKK